MNKTWLSVSSFYYQLALHSILVSVLRTKWEVLLFSPKLND